MRFHPVVFLPLALAGCGGSAQDSTDAASRDDAIAHGNEAGPRSEAGPRNDAGTPTDSAPGTDGKSSRDAAGHHDEDSGHDAGPPGTIPATFFNSSWNHMPPSGWCPTDGLGDVATVKGARLWDDGLKWADLESAAGVYTSAFDTTLKSFLGTSYVEDPACSMDVLYTFGATPAWAALPGTDPSCAAVATSSGTDNASCIPPKDLDSNTADCNGSIDPMTSCGNGADALFQSIVYKIVSTNVGKIKYYECWNEPDGSGIFWSNSKAFGGSGHAPTESNVPPLIRLARMCYDMMEIVHQTDPAAIVLSPSFHGPTALTWMHYFATTSVAQPGCSGTCSAALGGATWPASTILGAQTFDTTNAHLRGSPNTEPENFLGEYRSAITEIANDKLPISLVDDEWGPVNQTSPAETANLDVLASYLSRGLTVRGSVYPGVERVWLYQWDSPNGTGVSAAQGNIAGTAWDVTAKWLTGSKMEACTTTGTIWQCPGTSGAGASFILAWDTSQSCDSGCTVKGHTFSGYGHYTDLTGTLHTASGGVVPLGLKPSYVTL